MCFSYSLSNGNKAFKKDISKLNPDSPECFICVYWLTAHCLFPPALVLKFTVDADQNRRGARVRFLDNKQSTYTDRIFVSAPTCHELELSVNVRDHHAHTVHTIGVRIFIQYKLYIISPFPS